jgi:hypothetical protein
METRPFGRPKSKWGDNIKTDFRVTWCNGVDWVQLAYNGAHWWVLLNMAMKFQFHKNKQFLGQLNVCQLLKDSVPSSYIGR